MKKYRMPEKVAEIIIIGHEERERQKNKKIHRLQISQQGLKNLSRRITLDPSFLIALSGEFAQLGWLFGQNGLTTFVLIRFSVTKNFFKAGCDIIEEAYLNAITNIEEEEEEEYIDPYEADDLDETYKIAVNNPQS